MRKLLLLLLLSTTCGLLKAQQMADEILVIIGNNIILKSEVEEIFYQEKLNNSNLQEAEKCNILNNLIQKRMLLHQAELDSIVIEDERVEAELDKRIRIFISMVGSREELEKYYGKTIIQIKNENREKIKQEMLVDEMKGKVLQDVKVTPVDVKKFYNSIPKDSLPRYSAEAEVGVIRIDPKVGADSKKAAYDKIAELRERILKGEDFGTLALLYSKDPGSAARKGELGEFGRGDMVPEFEATAFRLKPDTVSKIIETAYGYHIMKLLYRKGDRINVQHILIRPEILTDNYITAQNRIDSIREAISTGTITFEEAARRFSDDDETRGNGGLLMEPATGTTRIPLDELDKEIALVIANLKPGETSKVEAVKNQDGSISLRIVYLKALYPPHVANLKDDYQRLQQVAQEKKQSDAIQKWMDEKRGKIYVKVTGPIDNCPALESWTQNPN